MPGDEGAGWADLRAGLEADVRRVSDRLGGLSAAQLAAPLPPSGTGGPPYPSRAQAARAVAQALAETAESLELGGPTGRELPQLADFAAADQLAVTGHDLLAALDDVGPDGPVRDVVARAAWLLADLRRRL